LRSIFTIPAAYAPTIALTIVLTMAAGFSQSSAQGQDGSDDLYGVPGGTPVVDTGAPPAAAMPQEPPPPDTARAPAPARQRVTRETTINPIDAQRGGYRNPKKALFMSLMVPGLGQAYVGQSKFTYARAALYLGTEVTLMTMWYQFTVVKYDREVKRYRRYADEHWSQGDYEDRLFLQTPPASDGGDAFRFVNPYRSSYCDAVQETNTDQGKKYNGGCKEPYTTDTQIQGDYINFANEYDDQADDADARGVTRAAFADPVEFYALIGSYQEFVAGWDDALGVNYSDTAIAGTSAHRDTYNGMRQKAQDYSRMQAWFIGGIVLNHIASAVDAALTARHNNKMLYEGDARWFDRLKMDGGLAFEQGRPRTHMTARLSF
jgi:hypothetical protein